MARSRLGMRGEVFWVSLYLLMSKGIAVVVFIILYSVMDAEEYSMLMLAWGGGQLLVSIIGQPIMLQVMNGKIVKLSKGALFFVLFIVACIVVFYAHLGVLHLSNPGLIFFALVPVSAVKSYLYGCVVKKKPRDVIKLVAFSFLFFVIFVIFVLSKGPVPWGLISLLAIYPVSELALLTILRPKRGLLSGDESRVSLSDYIDLVSVSNSSQFSMQVFLGAASKIGPDAGAVVALAYQLRSVPLIIASSLGQAVIRRGVGLTKKMNRNVVAASLFLSVAVCFFVYLYAHFFVAFEGSGKVELYLVVFQVSVWFYFSAINGALFLKSRRRASVIAFMMLVASIVIYFLGLSLFYSCIIYFFLIMLVAVYSGRTLLRVSYAAA